jgi:UDP-N-acetylmuramoyl-L-alanyl-D-glutamate--2,6-diaminopimelate ligase
MRLEALVPPDIAARTGSGDVDIAAITADSRQVTPGTLFAALPGSKVDGAVYVPQAVAAGASAVLVGVATHLDVPASVAVLRAREPRLALAQIAARWYPRQPATIVAITGTNGKTSIAEFTRQIFAALGHTAASLGTLGVVRPDGTAYGSLTTPDPVTLHHDLQVLADEGVTHLAVEASSHGLDQYRLDGVRLAAAAFNNLGRDHLDYHPSVEAYLDAKLGLFRRLLRPGQPAIVNADGAAADRAVAAAEAARLEVLTVGRQGTFLRLVEASRSGFTQSTTVEHRGHRLRFDSDLIGSYQISNALVAAAFTLAGGAAFDAVVTALARLQGVKGRLEIAARHNGGLAIVDYAHKPEALAAALDALRPFASGRLITVFGCGGDRDRGKRPIMGGIAAAKSDLVIVTDDNPRTEEPARIRAEVLAGCPDACEIGDRAAAIAAGVALLSPGDVLLVAGKGHESGQIVGTVATPFLDHDAITAAIAARPYSPT